MAEYPQFHSCSCTVWNVNVICMHVLVGLEQAWCLYVYVNSDTTALFGVEPSRQFTTALPFPHLEISQCLEAESIALRYKAIVKMSAQMT